MDYEEKKAQAAAREDFMMESGFNMNRESSAFDAGFEAGFEAGLEYARTHS